MALYKIVRKGLSLTSKRRGLMQHGAVFSADEICEEALHKHLKAEHIEKYGEHKEAEKKTVFVGKKEKKKESK